MAFVVKEINIVAVRIPDCRPSMDHIRNGTWLLVWFTYLSHMQMTSRDLPSRLACLRLHSFTHKCL